MNDKSTICLKTLQSVQRSLILVDGNLLWYPLSWSTYVSFDIVLLSNICDFGDFYINTAVLLVEQIIRDAPNSGRLKQSHRSTHFRGINL